MSATTPGWTVGARWPIVSLRRLARLESGHTPSRQSPEYWIESECTIPWFSLADVWQLRDGRQKFLGETTERISATGMRNSAARLLPAGTVALSRTASVGFSGIMPLPMATTQDFANWVPSPELSADYLYWTFQAMAPEFERLRVGSTHKTIYMPDIKALQIVAPPLPNQTKIANFLDARTASIDVLIAKKERLIELLQEKRQALITQAVTKGLDPNVPMKDSGVEWLGQIPAHWVCAPLYSRFSVQLGKMLDEKRDDGTQKYPYLRNANVSWDGIDTSDVKTMTLSDGDRSRYRLRKGDLLVCEGGANINVVGKSAIWNGELAECYYQKALHRLRPLRSEDRAEFLRYVLWSAWSTGVFIARANPTTVFHLTAEKLREYRFPFPPPDEQAMIVAWLKRGTIALENCIRGLRVSQDRLREYRQAVITEAVTGKLEIHAEPA